jgi:BirA family transcriptional regulator, biotin operon repressor / biotin---[acetyl-CoA-carboxylase] ligase
LYKIPAKTLFIGQSLVFMPECHSTNDEALRLIREGQVPEGTVVITDNQTAGRGQRNNAWVARPGENLTFSIVLHPGFLQPKDQFQLNMCIALGITDFLEEVFSKELVQVKWPNDIIVNNKKVCGILIENQLSGSRMNTSIAGIGLNVNQQQFDFEQAGSLALVAGRQFALADVLKGVLEKIESRYLMLRSPNVQKLNSDYLSKMYWMGEWRIFADAQSEFTGKITGIDASGRLLIETNNDVKVYSVKEIRYLR